MLYKNTLAPVEFKVDMAGRTISGYAAIFGNRDLVGDVIEPGAFTKTIAERLPKKLIKLVGSSCGKANHMSVAGLPVNLFQDSVGLGFEGKCDTTEVGDETLARVASGSLSHASIGYDTVKADLSQDGVDEWDYPIYTRHLLEVKLYDVGPVDYPANELATISGQIKSVLGEDPEVLLDELPRLVKSLAGRGRLTSNELKYVRTLAQGLPGVVAELQALLEPAGGATSGGKPAPTPTTPAAMDAKSLEALLADMRGANGLLRSIHV